jgi:hypothetical protein
LLTLIDKIVRAVALYCGGAVLAILMTVIIVDVTGRYVFNTPLDGSLDLSIVLLVLAVSCAIGYGGRTGAHVTADMVTTVVGPTFEWISGLGIKTLAAGVTAIWSWRLFITGTTAGRLGESTQLRMRLAFRCSPSASSARWQSAAGPMRCPHSARKRSRLRASISSPSFRCSS